MEAKVLKWGNSDAVRLPKVILNELSLKTGDRIEIIKDGDSIKITKIRRKPFTLDELLSDYPKELIGKEYDWGKPVGKEIW